MSAIDLVRLAILVSIVLIVLSFGLLTTWHDVTSLFRDPSLLLRSLLAMNVLPPLFAASLSAVFSLRPAVTIALIALAASPVPPFLPMKQRKLVGNHEYVYGLWAPVHC